MSLFQTFLTMLRSYKFEDVAKSGWQFFVRKDEVKLVDRKVETREYVESPTGTTLEGYTVDTLGELGLGSS